MGRVIIAFDPGAHTGVCVTDGGKLLHHEEIIASHNRRIVELVEQTYPDLIIYEGFRLFPNKAQSMSGSSFVESQQIGVIKYVAERDNIPIIEQMPGVKRFFMPPHRLALYGFGDIKSEHARDAARHILYYLVFKTKEVLVKKEEPLV